MVATDITMVATDITMVATDITMAATDIKMVATDITMVATDITMGPNNKALSVMTNNDIKLGTEKIYKETCLSNIHEIK
jgi:CMP-2-keto-3-deoxyoctulosonic acid synthetase